MSKKLFFGMFVAAGMLLATSCSKDELGTASSGNEAQVTFSLGLEGRIATRAISDGESADKLVYAVFNENGERISGIGKVEKTSVSFPTTETLTLAKGQTYKVAFWAQDADCDAYTIDDNMNVTVSYDNATNNDETRDAFFKTTDAFTVTGSTSMDVVLKRPFAQINVGVEETDWDAAVASGIEIEKSTVTIKQAATKINLVTGAVSSPTDVTYTLATIPAEDLQVDADGDEVNETYKWLSMSYILVDDESEAEGVQGAQKATLEGLEFTFQPTAGNNIILKDGLNSVPVQRNWRTNILGKLLTGDITFTIKIDPNYDGDNNVFPVGDAQALMEAIKQGGTVTLTDDVVLSEPLVITDGKTVTINLNGHNIVNTNQSANATTGVFFAKSGSKLTIQGEGIIDGGSGSASNLAVWAYPNSEVNISGGTFTVGKDKDGSGNPTIYTTGGTINISGGTFKTECDDKRYILNVGQTQGATGTIIVTGGTFIGYNPAAGDDNLGGSFVAEGYTSVKVAGTDDNYAVVPSSVVTGDNTVAAVDAVSLAAAASSGESQNIVLTQDVELTQALTFKGDVVLNGGEDNNVQITGKPLYFNGGKTTIKGIKFNNGTTGTESSMYFSDNDTKNVLIEDCEFLNAKWDNIQLTKAEESVAIRNCTFKNTEQGYRYIHLEIRDKTNGNQYATTNATLEITGCTFENVSTSYCKDSAITILGFFMKNMTIKNNTVKGDGANNLTTNIIWICDGKYVSSLMSVDEIKQAFTYVE